MRKPTAKSVEEVNIYLEGLSLRIPDTSTDNAVPRFDGTGGALQNSGVTIDDSNNVNITDASDVALRVIASAGSASLAVSAPAGADAGLQFRTGLLRRWDVNRAWDAESGSNAGSTFNINRYNDAGEWLSTSVSIDRATGRVTFGDVTTTAGLEFGSSGPRMMVGTGSPEGAVTAPAGSQWWQTDHATFGYVRWVKDSGTGNTGWLLAPDGRVWVQGVRTSNQSVSDITSTVITYTAETDRFNMLDTGTGKVTLPVAGLWEFSAQISWATDFANWQHASILNETAGTTVASLRTASGPYQVSLSGLMSCSASDVMSVSVFQDSTGSQNVAYARFVANLVGT